MQMTAKRSDEEKLLGLGWVDGEVKKFDQNGSKINIRLPHMGWNDVTPRSPSGLFRNLGTNPRFYFLHSYYFHPHREDQVLAVTDYDGSFASAICSGNIFGVQFHPEKSHHWGIQLLKNFAYL